MSAVLANKTMRREPFRLLRRFVADADSDKRALIAGLLATPASIAPRYFYDELGCALYGAICRLPEYYPTRTEIAIFREHRADIARHIGRGKQFVDLGSGDCCKAESWLPFLAPSRYVAVDIAESEITRALTRLHPDFPEIELLGVVTDFSAKLDLDGALDDSAATFFYPGSSIGNFTPAEAQHFLAQVHAYCAARPGSGLLIGVDCRKDRARLDAAYDDPLGVTAAFNRNVLLHVNRVIGSDFALEAFVHRGFFNERESRIEMHLEAVREQRVAIGDRERAFAAGERIHTENSYKYRPQDFVTLLTGAGFGSVRVWQDSAEDFAVFYAE